MTTDIKFKNDVYRLVKRIPRGKVTTYGQIASKINQISKIRELISDKSESKNQNYRSFTPGVKGVYTPGVFLARAVGNALNVNKDPIVPCHRVVDRNGRIAANFGFGGAIEQRRRLLAEGVKFKDEMHVDLELCLW